MFRLARRAVGFALLVAAIYLGVTFAQVWQASRRDDARRSEAIVVFGAAQYNGRPSAVLRARLDHAAMLYRRGIAPTIVVTGGKQPADEVTEAAASADYLAQKGIRQAVILRENRGTNSWQSMAAAAHELRARGKERVVLVTDPFHAARVAAMADELGLDAVVSPTRTSPISGSAELRHLGRETVAVAAGRVVGFRRLMRIDHAVFKVRDEVDSG